MSAMMFCVLMSAIHLVPDQSLRERKIWGWVWLGLATIFFVADLLKDK